MNGLLGCICSIHFVNCPLFYSLSVYFDFLRSLLLCSQGWLHMYRHPDPQIQLLHVCNTIPDSTVILSVN